MKCELCIHYGVCQNDTSDNYSEYCAWYEEELPKIDILYIINVLYDYWEEYGQRYDYLDHLINRLVEKYDLVYYDYNYHYREDLNNDRQT